MTTANLRLVHLFLLITALAACAGPSTQIEPTPTAPPGAAAEALAAYFAALHEGRFADGGRALRWVI